jgi:hypothetical protein
LGIEQARRYQQQSQVNQAQDIGGLDVPTLLRRRALRSRRNARWSTFRGSLLRHRVDPVP